MPSPRLFYVANWHFIVEGSNYFARTGATSPLLHTWSLAVEEQFYLVWPIVVLVVLRTRLALRLLLFVSVVGALASALVMALLYSPADQNRVYYGTDTRAQSLLVGAALSVGLTLWANRRAGSGDVTSTPSAWKARSPESKRVFVAVGIGGSRPQRPHCGHWSMSTMPLRSVVASSLLRRRPRASWPAWSSHRGQQSPLARTGAAAIPGSHLLRDVPVALPALLVDRWFEHGPAGRRPLHPPVRLHRGRRDCLVLRRRATDPPTSLPPNSVEGPGGGAGLDPGGFVIVFAATSASVTAAPTTFRPPIKQTGPLYTGPPVKLLLVGDSTAYTLGLGLSAYQRDYDIKMKDAGILGCGVTNGSEYRAAGRRQSDGEPLQRCGGRRILDAGVAE